MVVYAFYIFDRHASCIYKKKWLPTPTAAMPIPNTAPQARVLSAEDDAKLVFGTVFSLRNMVRKLGGVDDNFISYRTGHYKLHYYETPTNLKFVMVTDTKANNLRIVLHQIYVGLYVEYGMFAHLSLWYGKAGGRGLGLDGEGREVQEMVVGKGMNVLIVSDVVVKNPLAPVEYTGGAGINCEMFELGLEQFVGATLQG
ncbi:TRAPP subunit bet5 [Trapelia coarctata]|nr:TRAPP subunit bet5 [Trapelia coarctata]